MSTKIGSKIHFELIMSSSRYVWARHMMLQIMLFILSLNAFGSSSEIFVFNEERFRIWVVFYGMLNVVCYVNMFIFVPKLFMRKKILFYLLCIFLEVILFMYVIVIIQSWANTEDNYQNSPILLLVNLIASFINICIIIISTTTLMLFRFWTKEMLNVRELEVTTRNTELEILKSQINPHFLFNTLNNANVLLRESDYEASQVLFKLEDLIRYQFKDCSKERVMLKNDIQFLNDYLNLEKIRRDKFDFGCSVNGMIDDVSLPPLLFIPFVENAVKHNSDSGAKVDMKFTINRRNLIFECENTKTKEMVNRQVGGLGLSNIRRRLELLYPDSHVLKIYDEDDSFKIVLTIYNLI